LRALDVKLQNGVKGQLLAHMHDTQHINCGQTAA